MPDATIRAAQYLRMSTEHQTYSMANQAAAIAAYAAGRGYEIVRTYADAGISGLTLKARAGLKALLADVLGGGADFTAILVLDVSRWGRFQDPDQGAHYEFLCRQAGVSVDYCAEPFAGDGSLSSTLMKHLKRAMAAEFSRELSAKVTAGKRRLAAEGYWVGGPPGYGLQRRVIGRDGTLGHVLKAGERKSIQTDRVVLVPGPAEEVETVRRIFRLFVVGGLSRPEIARTLRREGTLAEGGASWSPWRVRQVLTNEKYVGANVYGRVSTRLGSACRVQPPQLRVRTPGAFEPTVSRRLFDDARRHIEGRGIRRTDEQLLEILRAIAMVSLQAGWRISARSPLGRAKMPSCSEVMA